MNLYRVHVKRNSYGSDTEQVNVVASNTTRASELAMVYAKRQWTSPEVREVLFDRVIHKVSK